MKTALLIGLGHFGRHIAAELAELGVEIMAVDIHEERANEVLSIATNVQIGDATNPAFLRSLGVDNYDMCIVTIGENFQNSLETTSLLKEMGAKFVASRAGSEFHAKFLLRNGADEVIYPEKQVAKWAAIRYSSEQILDYFDLEEGYAVFEITVPKDWIGKSMIELDIRKRYRVNVIAVKEKGKIDMSFAPDAPLTDTQSLLVLGDYKTLQKHFQI